MHYSRWWRTQDTAGTGTWRGVDPRPIAHILRASSGDDLALRFGVSRRTIVRWRQGGRIGDPDSAATVLGRHPSEIWP